MAVQKRMTIVDAVARPDIGALWDVLIVVTFAALMAVFAQVSAPLPFTPVPLTGQTFGVLLTGALLGSRRGAAAMGVYLLEGAAGLPVFALGHSGLLTLMGPTGGYLLAYPAAAWTVGALCERGWDSTYLRASVAMLAGEAVIYVVALPWLAHFVGAPNVLGLGLFPFVPGDVVKLFLAAALLPSAWRLLGVMGRYR